MGGSKTEQRYGKIANASVHVALNQLRKLANKLNQRFGQPDKIHIEFGRELKNSPQQLREIEKSIKDNTKLNQFIKNNADYQKALDPSLQKELNGRDIKKIRLWEELAHDALARNCLYCGRPISAEQLFNSETAIEHMLPRSWSFDDSKANLTITHKSCNDRKNNQTPFEFVGEAILDRLAHTQFGASKKWRCYPDAREIFRKKQEKLLTDDEKAHYGDDIDGAWRARQRTDNAYIARVGRLYLSRGVGSIHNVVPFQSKYIESLRRVWRFNELLSGSNDSNDNAKNRQDHRHHSIDALLTAVATLSDHQKANFQAGRGADPEIPQMPAGLREQVEQQLSTMKIALKPRHKTKGKMYKETAYGLQLTPQERQDGYQGVSTMSVLAYVNEKLKNLKKAEKEGAKDRNASWRLRNESLQSAIDNLISEIASDFKQAKQRGQAADEPVKSSLEKTICHAIQSKLGVKRVRYIIKGSSLVPIPSAPYKAYDTDSYACAMVWKIPDKKKGFRYTAQFIPYHLAPALEEKDNPLKQYYRLQDKGFAKFRKSLGSDETYAKPHPAAKFVMILYKDDLVAIKDKGDLNILEKNSGLFLKPQSFEGEDWIICRVGLYNIQANALGLSYHYSAQSVAWQKSVNALFADYDLRKILMSIDGQHRLDRFRG